jgi:hypothetical protein
MFVDSEPLCGCDIHPTDIVDIVVSSDGQIILIKSQKFYEFDGCVD